MNEGGEVSEPVNASPDLEGLPLQIGIEYANRVNFALRQIDGKLVDRIRLTNTSSQALERVSVEVSLASGECEEYIAHVESISPGSTYSLEPQGLILSPALLAARTEAESTLLSVSVICGGRAARKQFPIELLAFDEWPGTGLYPELLAAFVTPNHAKVAEMLASARPSLRAASGRDAFDGYQSGSRGRACQIAEACFVASKALGIGYINPPASFEQVGQRVRLVDRVYRERLGSCLDLSVLLASLWEQAGLHPVILLLEGHAIPAVWTHETQLPEPSIDDPARVRNLIKLGEIVAVESTLLTDPNATFQAAVASAAKRLDEVRHGFLAVDIRCSRKRGVRPLPLRDDTEQTTLRVPETFASDAVGTELDAITLAERVEGSASEPSSLMSPPERPSDRVKRWQSRLLDLTLLNRLINFKETGRTIRLDVPDVAALENRLASEQSASLQPKSDGSDEFRREQLGQGIAYTTVAPAGTQSTLLNLYRTRNSTIEETGANPLYLAIGMLKWFEKEESEISHRAPILLLPAQLTRQTAASGYRYDLSLSDEPIRPNVTLLEKLRIEYGLDTGPLAEIPEDDHGIDVPRLLRNFRSAIRDMRRWEVEESAYLGLFSFNKFLMWRDLQEHLDTLKKNRLVEHLLQRPGQTFGGGEETSSPERLDDVISPGDLYCTRDADSSQLAAIRAASNGATFVLEGPPGTGKSQTIANMIADAIARGKRVLFVAEKMAALGVVRSRLEKDGLGDLCLELHSAKASKKEVLAQLESASNSAAVAPPQAWTTTCANLTKERDALNDYSRQLHAARPSGETIYQVMGRLTALGDGPRAVPDMPSIADVTAEQLERWRQVLDQAARASEPVDPVHTHPLRGIGRSKWSFRFPEESAAAMTTLEGATETLRETLDAATRALGLTGLEAEIAEHDVQSIATALAIARRTPGAPLELIRGVDAAAWIRALRELTRVGRQRDAEQTRMLAKYRPELLERDTLPLLDQIARANARKGLLGIWARISAKRAIRPYCASAPSELTVAEADLRVIGEVRSASAKLAASNDAARLLGPRWRDGRADWQAVSDLLDWCEEFRAAAEALRRTPVGARFADSLEASIGNHTASATLDSVSRNLNEAWEKWNRAWAGLAGILMPDRLECLGAPLTIGWLERVRSLTGGWRGALDDLNAWCMWRDLRDQAKAIGLGPVLGTYERGACAGAEIRNCFERGYGHAWYGAIADQTPAIRDFTAASQTDRISRFAKLDAKLMELTPTMIRAKAGESRPDFTMNAPPQSEVGILRRELQKKARHLPTRKLVQSIPNLLGKLKPCFLMSPLSVAQYLDAKLPAFDLVVFDEASQIPVWDAIGAIARGKEVIVVGDSKQLPPTNFFKSMDEEETEEHADGAVEDMESILQECNASGIPSMMLNWHYRSRHESLIAFSNHHYYRNRLHTFPSPVDRSGEIGVWFRHLPQGVYDRGGSRANRIEAGEVVEEVVRLLTSSDRPDSIGIVTFSAAQQTLIEDLLDAKRRERPEIERFFTREVAEPVFVKNLENVQGDERDTIIFSIGYGKDQMGKTSMHFGPLNLNGGERRLNVAVTRARKRLIVFSNLRSDEIDLRRTRALGVAHLKTFLDYADRGPQAIAEALTLAGTTEWESGFEHAVWKALTDLGWSVDTQVGCAGYRVDLAVRDPERPGRYLIGIECDGATYHSGKTARDRDRLRESVLRDLGWTIARVWSTDWRINPQRCLDALEQAIQRAGSAKRTAPRKSSSVESEVKPSKESPSTLFAAAPAPPRSKPGLPEYRVCPIPNRKLGGMDPYDASAVPLAVEAVKKLVAAEGPVHESLAMERLAGWFGLKRMTERLRSRLGEFVAEAVSSGVVLSHGDALWPLTAKVDEYALVRVPGSDPASKRDIELIPEVERVNAVVHVVRHLVGVPREDLERQVGRLFGIQRLSGRSADILRNSVDKAASHQKIAIRDGTVVLA